MRELLITLGVISVLIVLIGIANVKNNLTYKYRVRLLDTSIADYKILKNSKITYTKMFLNIFKYWTFKSVLKEVKKLKEEPK